MSELGTLSQCLVDSDAEASVRARRLRRRALAASLILEMLFLTLMLICPLVTPGVLPRKYAAIPLPPIGGNTRRGENHAPRPIHPPPIHVWRAPICIVCAPPMIPPHWDASGDMVPPETSADDAVGGSNGPGTSEDGPGIPGSLGPGNPFDVMKPGEAPPSTGPVPMSEGVMEASLIHRMQPEYPVVARAAGISGRVELRAIIGTDGRVRHLEVMSGHPLLAQAAVAAVRLWRYRPTLLNYEPVEVETFITVDFRLR